MAKRIDVSGLSAYYGAVRAIEDISLTVEPRTVTAFIGPSGCGKSTFLRTLNRMHEVIPGARVEGKVMLDDENLYGPDVDAVAVRRTVGMVFQRPNPFPTMSIFENVAAGLKLNGVRKNGRHGRHRGAVAARGQPVERGQGPAEQAGHGPVRRTAAAAVHRPGHRSLPRRAADGRALLRARPDLDPGHRGPDRAAQERVHDRHRHAQHAAGRARLGPHRLLQHRGHRQAGQAGRDRRHPADLREPLAARNGGLHHGAASAESAVPQDVLRVAAARRCRHTEYRRARPRFSFRRGGALP